MDSYIEIAFLTNLLCSVFSYHVSGYFTYSKNINYCFYMLLFIEQIFHFILFNPMYDYVFYIYECLFYSYLMYRNIKKCIIYISTKYLILILLWKWFGGSFHLLHYYGNVHTNLVMIWIVLIILIILLKTKWSHYLKVSDFIYDVYFYCEKPFHIKGFLDTGNNVSINEIPVIFVDHSFKKYFENLKYDFFNTYTIDGYKYRKAYLCEVRIKGYKKEVYYICCDETLVLEFQCKCLLNMEG